MPIGDARLLHAAHANATDQRRTLITLWYQPDRASLPERVQAQMARYDGAASPYRRTLYRPRPPG